MNVIRHSAAAALIAALFATTWAASAGAAEEAGAPQPGFAQGAPDGGPDGGPGGPGGPGFFGPGGHGPEEGPGPHHGFGGHGPGAPGPELPFGGMPLHGLKLSEAQQDKLFAIMHDQAPARRDHEKAIRKAEDALRELGHADKFDDAKASGLSRDLGQAIAADALLRARTEAKVLAVLTPEQRTQLKERREHGPMGPHERPPGQPGEGRPQGAPGQPQGPQARS